MRTGAQVLERTLSGPKKDMPDVGHNSGFRAECERVGLANQVGYRWKKLARHHSHDGPHFFARHRVGISSEFAPLVVQRND